MGKASSYTVLRVFMKTATLADGAHDGFLSTTSLLSKQQVVDLILNQRLTSRIPNATRRAVDSTRALILQGKFLVPGNTAVSR